MSNNTIADDFFSTSPRSIRIDTNELPPRTHRGNSMEDTSHNHPRLSPTISRGYDPNDPDARERQRTMDADSAMLLARARSASIAMPSRPPIEFANTALPVIAASPPHPHPSPHYSAPNLDAGDFNFPNLSSHEEEQMHLARGEGLHPDPDDVLEIHLNHHDPMLDGTPAGTPPDHMSPEVHTNGMPMYQPAHYQAAPQYQHAQYRPNVFDFSLLETFAKDERQTLGLKSPLGDGMNNAASDLRRRLAQSGIPQDPTDAPISAENGGSGGDLNFATRRQRKLSQGNSENPRRTAGKLALFEGLNRQPLLPQTSGKPGMDSHRSGSHVLFSNLDGAGGDHVPNANNPGAYTGHDRPYRFSFYSNALPSTIHARSLSELPAEGQSFEDLFFGKGGGEAAAPREGMESAPKTPRPGTPGISDFAGAGSAFARPKEGLLAKAATAAAAARGGSAGANGATANGNGNGGSAALPQDIEGNTWWLDILCPTDDEMKLLSKVFSIHPLTTEDIQMEETREKIELFRNYYFVCFRGFDQDPYSPTHLEPLNMYIIVFREGTLSFHFRGTPHPQNVRRRIKQLKDYISVSADWISYALIDDITDAFGPLIQIIEYEVDSIDELVLILKETEQSDMLRRIGTCRKKVMGLLRLMGNKADVVKGLAKRCNENWSAAPTSDIGLYLSDIQDHLVTMTQNLNHYEKILSRSHSNYLAQISIEMTDANNQINDVLSKLTALGTVLIPMNLVTGLWGMNVHVPGQDDQVTYTWFISIIGALVGFGVIGSFFAYKLMVSR
ncbi:hypothetical protein BOTBODRAFT_37558 [Botryobasidium botryosum FD-172 SS1]|uniref:Cora-domain-containing protein n=1 Tax=Botryobasidium botryosum (strain FD-172 SS1) TaxID=930990 RepID=A0A067M2F0_BOTB1|nr:hypothetical protein BOTBODRAFT_37558 [Botryobasidium botryosum FD-172 SS1]